MHLSLHCAFRRLVARRGNVKNIYSDNETCFVRADKDLHEMTETQNEEYMQEVNNEFTKNDVTWNFSPAGAPHFNGLAEAAVKTIKTHLKKTIG